MLAALGDPEPVEVERKFVLPTAPDLTHPALASAVAVHLEQVYLPATDAGEQRLRARTCAGVTTYTHAAKRDVGAGARVEVETPIGEETYRLLVALRDPATRVVRKTRRAPPADVESGERRRGGQSHLPADLGQGTLRAVGYHPGCRSLRCR